MNQNYVRGDRNAQELRRGDVTKWVGQRQRSASTVSVNGRSGGNGGAAAVAVARSVGGVVGGIVGACRPGGAAGSAVGLGKASAVGRDGS